METVKFLVKMIMGIVIIFVCVVFIMFAIPAKAGTDWACVNGGTKLNDILGNVSKAEKSFGRSWVKIEGSSEFQILFILFENGHAEVHILVNQCDYIGKRVPPQSIVSIFNLERQKVFPWLKKSSF